ncbi:MAG TPA: SurA N-terminal domain-containing protein [Thermoanaerobaculia bacterium]|nr:SurA N-terminal domain-containing protein [Thermoanaerobaculia bacterium]
MLKVFRDNLKYLSWILWVVIGLFVLFVFVDFGSGVRQQAGTGAAVAARVGDRVVTREDFQREYRQLDSMYRQLYGEQFTPELAEQMRLPLQALERAVTEQILLAEAERLGLDVTDAEVRERILDEPVFRNPQGQFVGQEEYVRILSQNNFTPASFEQSMRKDLLRQKLQDMLRAGIWVGDAEVERSYREQVEKAKIRYVQLPRARFADAAAQITPAELQAYFQAHREEYKLPEQREGAYLLVEADQLRGQVQVTDEQLRQEYESKKQELSHPEQVQARHILVRVSPEVSEEQARAKLEQARQRVQAGADFGVVAGEVSEEPGAKERGGDLGWFGKGQMVKEFEEAALNAQPGQIVGPVKTQFGLHLIQVTGKRAAGATPFEEVKEQLRARAAFTRAQELAQTKAKELAAQLEKNPPKSPADLETIAKANPGVSSSATGKFGPQDPITGLGPAPALAAAAFALDKAGKVTQPVQVPRGWAVLWVSATHEPRVPDLQEVEPRVRATVAAQKMQERAVERLKQARATGTSLDQIAGELGLTVVESPEFGAQGAVPGIGVNPELVAEAMKLQPGQLGGPVADAQGALLFEVKERKAWDPIQFAGVREQTRASVQNEKLNQLLASLLAERRREMGVKYDQQLLDSLGITAEQLGPSQQG